MIAFKVNGQPVKYDGDAATPLLWVLRDHLQLTGTKFSCGLGLCGACVVHLNGRATAANNDGGPGLGVTLKFPVADDEGEATIG